MCQKKQKKKSEAMKHREAGSKESWTDESGKKYPAGW